jgi:hypothetical protein
MIYEKGNVLMTKTITNYEKIIYILLDSGDSNKHVTNY